MTTTNCKNCGHEITDFAYAIEGYRHYQKMKGKTFHQSCNKLCKCGCTSPEPETIRCRVGHQILPEGHYNGKEIINWCKEPEEKVN